MTIDTFYVFFDLTIIGLVCYVTHLLRCIARNTRKPDNKDLFQPCPPPN
jgi:hypothetical protein